jgi:hypothetical protein
MSETKENLEEVESQEPVEAPILKKKITRSRTQEHIEKSREALKKAHIAKMEQSLPLAQARADASLPRALKQQKQLEEKVAKMSAKKRLVAGEPPEEPPSKPAKPAESKPKKQPKKVIVQESESSDDSTDDDESSGDEIIYVAPKKKRQPKQETIVKAKAPAPQAPKAVPAQAPPKAVFKFV